MKSRKSYPEVAYPRPEGTLPPTSPSSWMATGAGRAAGGLPRIAGHKAGEESITEIIRVGSEWELEALSLFAFSTENWNRPRIEVEFLMSFNRNLLRKRMDGIPCPQYSRPSLRRGADLYPTRPWKKSTGPLK